MTRPFPTVQSSAARPSVWDPTSLSHPFTPAPVLQTPTECRITTGGSDGFILGGCIGTKGLRSGQRYFEILFASTIPLDANPSNPSITYPNYFDSIGVSQQPIPNSPSPSATPIGFSGKGCGYTSAGSLLDQDTFGQINGWSTTWSPAANSGGGSGNHRGMCAIDLTNGVIGFGVDGVWQGDGWPNAGVGHPVLKTTYFPACNLFASSTDVSGVLGAGHIGATLVSTAGGFAYTVPTGFAPWGS